ncbi:Alpha-D-phosphohexomutase superfamily [Parasponia andersonii]|uniref:Alpha-D-phosphohexomutase superfamily n=1 Tax=Parasponia andersonii TaxID=3476 RepID=A0A2P5CNV3_PARAD|nr:Alpha-D-phosphohexomutase superfamily [Parasponia andersonii]
MASTSTSTSSISPQNFKTRKPSLARRPFKTNLNSFPFSSHLTKPISSKSYSSSSTTTTAAKLYDNEVIVVDEEMGRIRRLQNGSDVRGVALEGEKGRTVDLTPPAVEAIAESFGEWVIGGLEREISGNNDNNKVTVSLGKDPRISGPSLSVAVFSGLSRAGCAVFDMGLATTPACFMSTVLPPFAFDASIMMTASHLPYTRNGLKFFTKKGGLTSPEVEEICDKAARKYANRVAKVSTLLNTPITRVNFMSTYATHLREIIKERINHPSHYDTPLQGFQEASSHGMY